MLEDSQTAPQKSGALVIDETGDRKDGKATAHVGKQYLGGIGKVDNGVVSVSSLYADERLYYPLEVEPYTPEHHFEGGKKDPEFRTKPQIAWELVERALEMELPFRAVVADSLYGENIDFCETLLEENIPFVMALGPSHAWWAPPEQVGNVWEAALVSTVSSWGGPEEPGDWVRLERSFRDGRVEQWWALEAQGGPYGPESSERLVVVTTDPATLPDRSTSYLVTNLPAPDSERAQRSQHSVADLAEVARLYALRGWIEQSYKQVKNSLGWAHYQVRKDLSIRRHWQLVCCAFSFCWWACTECEDSVRRRWWSSRTPSIPLAPRRGRMGGKRKAETEPPLSWPRALRKMRSWLQPYVMLLRYWRAYTELPPPKELQALLGRLFAAEGLYLYVH